jgi:hypothetical protein
MCQGIESLLANGGRPAEHRENDCVFREVTNDVDDRQQPPNPGRKTRQRYRLPDRICQHGACDRQKSAQREQIQYVERDNSRRVKRWVGLGVIADNIVNIGRTMEKQSVQ